MIKIRPANLSDALVVYGFICDLEETYFNETAFNLIFQTNLLNPAIHYLVAERNDALVGFVSCYVQLLLHHLGKVGEIQELYVRPDVRGQGVGQQLITALKALAQQEHWINLEVTTNQKRIQSIQFYERASFCPTHSKLVYPLQS